MESLKDTFKRLVKQSRSKSRLNESFVATPSKGSEKGLMSTPGLFDKKDKIVKLLKQLANKHGAHKFNIGIEDISVGFATSADAASFKKEVESKFKMLTVNHDGKLYVWIYPEKR